MRRILLFLLLSLALIGASPSPAEGLDRPRVEATRLEGKLEIDGALDEPAWARATPIRDFQLILQREGETPSESTEVRLLFDAERIYVGIVCANHGPGAIRASLTPRDRITDGDHIAIHFDTYRDMRRAYVFGINPYGVQLDGILDGDEPDFSWDAVWSGAARRGPEGWSAELAIPLHAIRFAPRSDGVWGLWIRREITKNDEVCSWPLWRQAEQGDIMLQAGDLGGLAGLDAGGGLDVEPYVSSVHQNRTYYGIEHSTYAPPQVFSFTERFHEDHAGLDLRYPFTSTLVANATLNPDYSQIEADAIQIDVNQRYPLFYPEKRPFFLEGAELFSTPLDLVYTRRIADPSIGGKLTGKQGRWSVGAIAVKDDGGASASGVGAGGGDLVHEGSFVITRLAYDAGRSSRLGFLATAHSSDERDQFFAYDPTNGLTVAQRGNVVLAGDSKVRLAQSLFFTGQAAWSWSSTDSSAGFFSEVLERTRATDVAYSGTLRWADGIRDASIYQTYLGPDFRDETGFIRRVDMRETGANTSFYVRPESRWLHSIEPILNGYAIHDHTGDLEEWWVSPMVDWKFQKQTHVHTMWTRSREWWLDRPFDLATYILNLDNSLWRPLELSFEMTVGDGIYYAPTAGASYRGWSESYLWEATARPSPRLTSELSAERRRFSVARGGDEVFDIWALGAKTTFLFTRNFYARVYPQYDTEARHLDADALLAYVLHPGSVLYLGWSGDYERFEGRQRPMSRTFFLKASHRFGI